jgi:hypothetical protein
MSSLECYIYNFKIFPGDKLLKPPALWKAASNVVTNSASNVGGEGEEKGVKREGRRGDRGG